MKEKNVRQKLFHWLHAEMGQIPITQTDLNAPFDIATTKRLMGQLIGMSKKYPAIKGVVFALKNVLDNAVAIPPIGRPDVLCNPEYVIEVKTLRSGETSFPMDRIDEKQRRWLDRWVDERKRPGYICLGIIRAHGSRDFLDHMYLIPWKAWRRAESLIEPFQRSIPYEAGKGYRKELQEAKLDILHLFKRFEMEGVDGAWVLPEALKEVLICEK